MARTSRTTRVLPPRWATIIQPRWERIRSSTTSFIPCSPGGPSATPITTLCKSLSRGVQFDFNYTYSKSMDISSDAERIGANGGLASGLGGVVDTWNPGLQRGISDFDTTHQLNANWIVQLPFGKGRRFGATSGRALDAVIGGWELSGLTRWTSGFPVNIANGAT